MCSAHIRTMIFYFVYETAIIVSILTEIIDSNCLTFLFTIDVVMNSKKQNTKINSTCSVVLTCDDATVRRQTRTKTNKHLMIDVVLQIIIMNVKIFTSILSWISYTGRSAANLTKRTDAAEFVTVVTKAIGIVVAAEELPAHENARH